jgi:hypothetical protein
MLRIPSLPKELHHMSWKDGGFSIPSLLDRSRVVSICSFAHMSLSNDPNIRAMTRAFIESERRFRHIFPEEETNTQFLNWKDVEDGTGTASFINNTRRAVKASSLQIMQIRITSERQCISVRQPPSGTDFLAISYIFNIIMVMVSIETFRRQ